MLLSKLRSVREIIEDISPHDTCPWDSDQKQLEPLNYSYEDFCRDLDVSDVYTRRLIELLVRETATRQPAQSAAAKTGADNGRNYVTSSYSESMYVETLDGVPVGEVAVSVGAVGVKRPSPGDKPKQFA